jgi:rRNA maturation RNase YbeY
MKTKLFNNTFIRIDFIIILPQSIKCKVLYFFHYLFNLINVFKFYGSINITNNNFTKRLNSVWLVKKESTDILTFSSINILNFQNWKNVIGDIIISLEKAVYHAHLLRVYIYEELIVLTIHGILHLLRFGQTQS